MTASSVHAPFLDVQSFAQEEAQAPSSDSFSPPIQSPFVSLYEMEGGMPVHEDPEAEVFASLVNDLHDEEFDEALFELYAEGRAIHDEHLTAGGTPSEAERMLHERFSLLTRDAEALVDEMSKRLASPGYLVSNEAEVEAAFEHYSPSGVQGQLFEDFFKVLKNKFKKLAKKAVSLAKNVALGPVFLGLRKLISPLLNKVLQLILGKLPQSLQPFARALAGKLGLSVPDQAQPAAVAGNEPAPEPPQDAGSAVQEAAGQGVGDVQAEFDHQLTQLLFARDGLELEMEVAQSRAAIAMSATPVLANLEQARQQLAQQLGGLQEGESAAPHIQNFIPALLPALKIGLRLIGRQRVVDFLANLLAKLIAKLIGSEQAAALSKAIVDAGLKFLNLEMNEADAPRLATEALAATIEEAVTRVASLPDFVLESEELLEAFAVEAFERAAAANLPALFSERVYRQRPDLLEGGINAGWVLLPMRGPKRCKKSTRIFKVRITPQMANEIETFEDETLGEYLQEHLGVDEGEEVEAEVHLFETLLGGETSDIVHAEQSSTRASDLVNVAQLHPLHQTAAAILFGRPGLGREVDETASRPAGQRMYHVAVPGRRLLPGSHAQMRRRLHVKLVLDAVGDQLRVCVYFSERLAQRLALRMREGTHHGTLVTKFNRLMERIKPRLQGKRPKRTQIVQAGITAGASFDAALNRMPSVIPPVFIAKTQEWLVKAFGEFIRTQASKFQAAAEQPADGVTLVFRIGTPPGLREIGQALAGKGPTMDQIASIVSKGQAPSVSVEVHAGHRGG